MHERTIHLLVITVACFSDQRTAMKWSIVISSKANKFAWVPTNHRLKKMKEVVVLLRCWLLSLDYWVDNSDNYILKNTFNQEVSTSLIIYFINLWVNAYCLLYSQLNVQDILSTTVSLLSGGIWYLNCRMRIQFSPVARVRQYHL